MRRILKSLIPYTHTFVSVGPRNKMFESVCICWCTSHGFHTCWNFNSEIRCRKLLYYLFSFFAFNIFLMYDVRAGEALYSGLRHPIPRVIRIHCIRFVIQFTTNTYLRFAFLKNIYLHNNIFPFADDCTQTIVRLYDFPLQILRIFY